MAAPLTEVEQLKRDAKLVGSLARQLPGLDVDQAQKILEAVQLELQRWIKERQSAQDLLRQVIAQHDEAKHDVKLIYGLTRYMAEKAMQDNSREWHAETLAVLEAIRKQRCARCTTTCVASQTKFTA
jgi:uncharacterized membrane protein YheB (UPF0754 family)